MLLPFLLVATVADDAAPRRAPGEDVSARGAPGSASDNLIAARAALEELAYERVLELCEMIDRDPSATQEQKLEALFMRGYSLALTNRSTDATSIFRKIVTEYDIHAEPPFAIEPSVQILLMAARNQERERRERIRQERRDALRKTIVLDVNPPGLFTVVGGQPAVFDLKLVDPNGVIESVRLEFKRTHDKDFSSLPFEQRLDGRFRAEIPGTFTRNTSGMEIAWVIIASDAEGPLVSVGTRGEPRMLPVKAGTDITVSFDASERLPLGTRIGYAVIVNPIVSTTFALAGVGASALLADFDPNIAWWNLMLAPPLLSVVGTAFITLSILDSWQAAVPSSVALGAGTAYFLLVFFAYGQAWEEDRQRRRGVPRPPLAIMTRIGARDPNLSAGGPLLAAAFPIEMLGILAASGAATALIIVNPASEE